MEQLLNVCEEILNEENFSTGGHLINFEFIGISSLHTDLLYANQLDDLLQTLQLNRDMEDNGFVWPYKLSLHSMPSWDRDRLKEQS
ncbi:hypothetical protein R0K20_15090, partial [Staphylococcus sp. SIMBA_130]